MSREFRSLSNEPRRILIHGLKRSGNHAIINWLLEQSSFGFFNNVIPIRPILQGRKEFPPPCYFNSWLIKRSFRAVQRGAEFNLLIKALIRKQVVVSFEDIDLSFRYFGEMNEGCTNVLILRDVENVLASRIKKGFSRDWPETYPRENNEFMQRVVGLWKGHAREALADTEFLFNRQSIYFDRWVRDGDYRATVCESLDLPLISETSLRKTAEDGGGSSFGSEVATNPEPEERQGPDVLSRRSHLDDREQSLLDEVLADAELTELRGRIQAHFG